MHEDESIPLYVVSKNIKENTITVGKEELLNQSDWYKNKTLVLTNTNWLGDTPKEEEIYDAMLRYHGELFPVKVSSCGSLGSQSLSSTEYKVQFVLKSGAIAPGQSIVIYKGDLCLGGGIAKYQ